MVQSIFVLLLIIAAGVIFILVNNFKVYERLITIDDINEEIKRRKTDIDFLALYVYTNYKHCFIEITDRSECKRLGIEYNSDCAYIYACLKKLISDAEKLQYENTELKNKMTKDVYISENQYNELMAKVVNAEKFDVEYGRIKSELEMIKKKELV